MKLQRNKTLSTIALILILTASAIMASMPIGAAHTPSWKVPTYLYISVSQNPAGVNQQIWMTVWLNNVPPGANGFGGDRFRGITISISKPDGTTETLGPFTSDPIGTKSFTYIPTQVGTYYIQAIYPGQVWLNSAPGVGIPGDPTDFVNDTFLASTSSKLEVTVQPKIASYPDYPLPGPNDYWNRPLYGDIRGWSKYASDWLAGTQLQNNFQPYGAAPNTAHILWAKPLQFGGIVGEQFGEIPYGTDDYENPWSGGIIIQGRLYYNAPMYPKYGLYCVDLRTGEQVWYNNMTELNNKYLTYRADGAQIFPQPSFGQLYWYYSLNGQGVVAYLWCIVGSNWIMLDALTGNWILTLANVPSGTDYTAPDGSLLRYTYNSNGWLTCWNSSAAIPPLAGGTGTNSQQWKPRTGATINATYDPYTQTSGYTWNKTAPAGLPGSISWVLGDRIIGSTLTTGIAYVLQPPDYTVWALSLKPGQEGTLLWTKTYTKSEGNVTMRLHAASIADKVFVAFVKETRQYYGYDLDTGNLLWGPTQSMDDWSMYNIATGTMGTPAVAYGKFYMGSYGGILYAYDIKTGKLLWTYNNTANIGGESPYGQYTLSMGAVADGKIYMYSSEHSPTKPLWRGSRLRCIDANTGKELWTVLTWARGVAIADGILVTTDIYSSQIYAFGRGQSAIAVTYSPVIGSSSSVLIQGTITDQSPGQTCLGIPAAGTPAVSDASMSQWMEYLYMQKPKPTNATGVPVTLTALDPNNNTENIGTVTSDTNGNYKIAWTPPVSGVYTITATFAGSESYYTSSAETAIAVSNAPAAQAPIATPAPTATPPPTATPTPSPQVTATPVPAPSSSGVPTTYIVIAVVAIIVVVAAAALALRRRK